MRHFLNLNSLIQEVRRDLVKSPQVLSTRVQHTEGKKEAHEALNYQYAIHGKNMPSDHLELAEIGAEYFPSWSSVDQMVTWLSIEYNNRENPLSFTAMDIGASEAYHPILDEMAEGNHWAYTYRERLIGMLPTVVAVLSNHKDSRRAYFPVFQPVDAYRAHQLTRIPCTLGYHFLVRDVPKEGPQLHVTNLQRSCHFSVFMLSDLWFTHLLQKEVASRLNIDLGMITHSIISLHDFIDEEIY